MSETLTEKWKNGTLKEGWYYLSIVPNKKCIDYFIGQDFERYNEWAIEEVLAPVPSYEEWEELQESNDGLSKLMFKSLMNKFVKADEERERLEEENAELLEKIKQIEELFQYALFSDSDGHYKPCKNTTKQEAYDILGKIQEMLGTNKQNGIYGRK